MFARRTGLTGAEESCRNGSAPTRRKTVSKRISTVCRRRRVRRERSRRPTAAHGALLPVKRACRVTTVTPGLFLRTTEIRIGRDECAAAAAAEPDSGPSDADVTR